MRPNDNSNTPHSIVPQRRIQTTPPSRGVIANQAVNSEQRTTFDTESQRQAAQSIARDKINALYQNDAYYNQQSMQTEVQTQQQPTTTQSTSTTATVQQSTEPQPLNPSVMRDTAYTREQSNTAGHTYIESDRWKQYHSAWQDYYKEYFSRYYAAHLQNTQAHLNEQTKNVENLSRQIETFKHTSHEHAYTEAEAIKDIRSDIRGRVQKVADNVRRSSHFVPILAALSIMVIFFAINYNRVAFAYVNAYITPGSLEPQSIIIDPTLSVEVGPEPTITIPKININELHVEYDTKPDQETQLKAMEKGLAWFGIPGANSKPGQVGNTVLSGHSSNGFLEQGTEKFVFARLDFLQESDTIYVNYEGKRYTYAVTKKEVVKPNNVGALVYKTDKPMLTLITCTPLGTADKRLLVTAEQIHPSPKEAVAAPKDAGKKTNAAMPGTSPTLVERLFGS